MTVLNTFTAMTLAAGATPLSADGDDTGPPTAMPATWVPCSQPASPEHGVAAPGWLVTNGAPPGHRLVALFPLPEKHASATTLPARYGWSTCTPVSRTAMVRPDPSQPACCAAGWPIVVSHWSPVMRLARFSTTRST